MCVCVRASMCVYLIKKNHFLDDTFRIWVNCFTETKGFWSYFYIVSTKCSDSSFVVLLVLAVILDMKLG